MSRTLEITFGGPEYVLVMGQIKNVTIDDVKQISFTELDKLSELANYDVEIGPEYFGLEFFSTDCVISNITVKNNYIIELSIEKNNTIFNEFHFDYPKLFYWSDKKEQESDEQIIKIDNQLVTCCGFYFNKANCVAILDDFEGDFDEKFITGIVSEPWDWFECWNYSDEFLHSIYYKDKKLYFDSGADGKGAETFYYDKGWNNETPILYYRKPKINLKDLLSDR